MSLAGLLTETATIIRRIDAGTVDEYGNPELTEDDPVTFRCRREPIADTEVSADRDTQIGDERLFLPPEADGQVDGVDRVEVADDAYEVVGPPAVQRSPRGVHHVVLHLRKVTG